ncbi:hypothetical protein SAMN05877838_2482 [Hoeflea halophila]|uniref:SH3b domain-containing protein n=1 Tax=Hoeflea halophila TaxID=714899 RepID=A0A286IBY1_9HYPH|nr:SH3 domain-containing protein [Hoeflea halophila]SOE17581.1 hypothetical protein SAMN05877838_2482 [Hoeflea halophila]
MFLLPRTAGPLLAATCFMLMGGQAPASEARGFQCGGAIISINPEPENGTARIVSPRGTEQLRAEADGVWRDATQDLQFYADENPPTMWMGSEQFSCKQIFPGRVEVRAYGTADSTETPVDSAGKSLGGRLRTGPGTNFGVAGSLAEGTPVTIVTNTGVRFDGYDWFEIRTGNGVSAYQWGGIMCSEARQIAGIYEQCQP